MIETKTLQETNNILTAKTLPCEEYTSDKTYQLELERIFYSKWIMVCHRNDLKDLGDTRTVTIGKKSIFVVNYNGADLKAYYNVCRHRGSSLLDDTSTHIDGVIQCPYHGWTYKLDGNLAGCPQMEKTVDFEKEDFPLYEVRLETWGGFVWINLNPKAEPLRKYLGDLPERFEKYSMESLRFFGTIGTYKVEANWKATVENANECYHCPLVHPETIGPHYLEHILFDNSKIHGPYTILYWENSTKGLPEGYRFENLPENLSGLTEEDKGRLNIVQVFPNTQLYFSPDRVTTFQVWPDGPHKSLITSQMYIQGFVDIDEEKRKAIEESIKWNDFINNQDIPLLEKQQKGLDSGVFEGGRFSALEGPVFGFQRLVSQALSD